MTRQEYIDAVKVKIEEISPFDEPGSFIDGTSDPDYDRVKPIVSYIEENLDEAGHRCLCSLPFTLLHADIQKVTKQMTITDGVGTFAIEPSWRFVRLRNTMLRRDITAFITTEDPLYLVQQNEYTRGKTDKPVAVISSDVQTVSSAQKGQMEVYSFPEKVQNMYSGTTGYDNAEVLYIDTSRTPGTTNSAGTSNSNPIKSPIEEYIVLECAKMVFAILGNFDGVKSCENERDEKIQAILK